VCVNDVPCKGLIDSGAQVTVMSNELFDHIKPEVYGHVNNQGIVGDVLRARRAPLVNVTIKSHKGHNFVNVGEGLQVTCAVAPLTNVKHDTILPNDIVNDIQCLPTICVLTCTVMNDSDHRVNVNSCNDVDDLTLSNYPANSNLLRLLRVTVITWLMMMMMMVIVIMWG